MVWEKHPGHACLEIVFEGDEAQTKDFRVQGSDTQSRVNQGGILRGNKVRTFHIFPCSKNLQQTMHQRWISVKVCVETEAVFLSTDKFKVSMNTTRDAGAVHL